jgi:hypothetical protein
VSQAASEQSKDASHVAAYKLLADLRKVCHFPSTLLSQTFCLTHQYLECCMQCFEELVQTVTEIGHSENAARDLEARSEQLSSRNTSNNMERILGDLEQVKTENRDTEAALRNAGAI